MRLPLWSLVLGVLAHSVLHAANTPPEIRNLKVQQRPGTYLVDITFDLVDPDSVNGVFLSAEASADNGGNYNLPAKTVTGDVGLVKPGTGKKIVWDAFTDWPDKYTPTAKVRIIAKDSLPQGPGPGPEGFVWIPPGKFMMGSPEDEPGHRPDETYHEVYINPGFWMCDHEVTQVEYQAVMGSNPSYFKGTDRPVEQVTWDDAVLYCQKLTEKERAAGRIMAQQAYRLPTEAEWEYAARAGTTGARYGDSGLIGWWSENSGNQTHPVRQLLPNPWGLYDCMGNVWEWCSDWYGEYPAGPVGNPKGPASGLHRLIRGNEWQLPSEICRVAVRATATPVSRGSHIGFRAVLSTAQP